MNAPKWYVVWRGRQPGIYPTWEACQAQVQGYPGAQFKAFPSQIQASQAFRGEAADYYGKTSSPHVDTILLAKVGQPDLQGYAVDAACAGNPGLLEYRGVQLRPYLQIFHAGPFAAGTNNIGEFLAIVSGLQWLHTHQSTAPLYSDSRLALKWVQNQHCATQCTRSLANQALFQQIAQAEAWLRQNPYPNRLLHWQTAAWGENPADFGRK